MPETRESWVLTSADQREGILQVFCTLYVFYIFQYHVNFLLSLYMKMEKCKDYDADEDETMKKGVSLFWDP